MENLWQDVRFAARLIRRSPLFSLIAILTLALGIGANAAIFSVVNGVLLRPLSYRQPQQLYLIREIIPQMTRYYPSFPANIRGFSIWQQECRSFDSIGIVRPTAMGLTGQGEPREINGGVSSANFFNVLGVRPQLGRSFFPEEDRPGHDHVVILTDSFWRSQFHADPAVVGRTISLDGASFEVVGILPKSFHAPKDLGQLAGLGPRVDFFKPLGQDPQAWGLIGDFDYAAVARLKPGVTAEQALAELNVVQSRIAQQANEGLDLRASLTSLETEIVGPARRGLLLLLAAVGAVLLIVCVNLANLLLARVPGRLREAAIRAALGASRSRLLRQMLTESLLLATIGGLLGVGLAVGIAVALLLGRMVRSLLFGVTAQDPVTIILVAAVMIFSGFLACYIPAIRATRLNPMTALRDE